MSKQQTGLLRFRDRRTHKLELKRILPIPLIYQTFNPRPIPPREEKTLVGM